MRKKEVKSMVDMLLDITDGRCLTGTKGKVRRRIIRRLVIKLGKECGMKRVEGMKGRITRASMKW